MPWGCSEFIWVPSNPGESCTGCGADHGMAEVDLDRVIADPRMHAVFLAHGSSFKRGLTIGRFESVEIYNLMAAVLDIEPALNDGDPAALTEVLRR